MLSARFKQRMLAVAALVIVVLGLVMLNRGAMLVGSPVTAQTVSQAVFGGGATLTGDFQRGDDGVVEIPLVISDVKFQPSSLALPANEAVRLVVDRQEANACSDQLAIPQLGVLVDLAPNAVTVVDVPAATGGNYTLTCGMGMMYGLLQVGAAAAAAPPVGRPLAIGIVALAVIGFFLWRTRRPVPARGGRGASGKSSAQAATILGFAPQEALVVVAAIAAAIIAGLLFGGMFTY